MVEAIIVYQRETVEPATRREITHRTSAYLARDPRCYISRALRISTASKKTGEALSLRFIPCQCGVCRRMPLPQDSRALPESGPAKAGGLFANPSHCQDLLRRSTKSFTSKSGNPFKNHTLCIGSTNRLCKTSAVSHFIPCDLDG